MNILAIDTAAALCAACLYDADAGAERGRAVRVLGKGHAEHVMAVIDDALKEAGLSYEALGAVAVATGPGSFTGVRVGVAAARGLALALDIPATGITTLAALAAEAREAYPGRTILSVVGNRPESLAMARYDASGACLVEPKVAALEDIAANARSERPVLAGDAAEAVCEATCVSLDIGPRAATADVLFYARLAALRNEPGEKPKPLYMRPPDAKPQAGFTLPRKAT